MNSKQISPLRSIARAVGEGIGTSLAGIRRSVALLAVALAIVTSLVLGSHPAGAQSNVYIVQPGDTLTGIAFGFYGNASYWPTIYQANRELIGGDPNIIVPGQRLVIPQAVSAQGIVPVAQTVQRYLVQPGDTLSLVALKVYGSDTLWPAIYEANRGLVGDPNLIRAGQVLTIPALSQQFVRQVSRQVVVTQPVVQPLQIAQYYRLVPGDTLVRISERFYGTWVYWPTIYALNRAALGPDPDSPPVGALIALPVVSSLPRIEYQPVIVQQVIVRQPIIVRRPVQRQPAQPDGPILILPGAPAQAGVTSGESAIPVQAQPIQGAAELRLPGAETGRLIFGAEGQSGLTYTVQQGDTLVTIARSIYGDPSRWPTIYNANLEVIGSNPAAVPVGATLTIPE